MSEQEFGGERGPCWNHSGFTWPGMPEGSTVHCELRAGHLGAHEADRMAMGGTAVWPRDADEERDKLRRRLYVALVEQRAIDSRKYGEAPYAPNDAERDLYRLRYHHDMPPPRRDRRRRSCVAVSSLRQPDAHGRFRLHHPQPERRGAGQ